MSEVAAPIRSEKRVRAGPAGRAVAKLLPLGVLLALALVGPLIARHDPHATGPEILAAPSVAHWLGTDDTGSDVFARLVHATGLDLFIGFASVATAFLVGVVIGAMVGYSRSWWPAVVMWFMDFLQSFPVFILALALVAARGQALSTIIMVIAFVNLPIFVRLVRAQVLSLRDRAFVDAARCAGCHDLRIALWHVLPNALTPALSQASVNIGWALLLTSGLTFIGAGIQPPTPEWGGMIANGADYMITGQWWVSFFPGVALGTAVVAFALAGDVLKTSLAGEP
jgi:peptide/nickel transport system permease protein